MIGRLPLVVRCALALALLLSAILHPASATACIVSKPGVYPTCVIPAPRPNERVTVASGTRGQAISSVTLGDDSMVTEVVDVAVEAADRPLYIALSSSHAVIWRFNGAVESISRVVVFGSTINGASHAGVIGVPEERLHLIDIDVAMAEQDPPNLCELKSLELMKMRTASVDQACRRTRVDADAYFAGVALSEREDRRAGAAERSRRMIDDLVEHPGKVALFLGIEGGRSDWHVIPSGATELASDQQF